MRRSLVALGLLTCLLCPPGARALQKPARKDRALPDFDSRLAALSVKPKHAGAGLNERLDLLRSHLAHPLRLRTHPVTGAVRVLWAEGEPLSDPAPSPRAAARRFLQENTSLLGLELAGSDSLVLRREEPLSGGALTRLVFDQVVDGTPVFGGAVIVHVDRLGRVVKLAAGPLHRGRGQGEPAPVPALTAEGALVRAVADVRPELKLTLQRRPSAAGVTGPAVFESGPLGQDAVVDLVWFPTAEGARLAFKARVVPTGFPQVYDIVVDAESGAVLYRRNLVRYAEGQGTVPQSDEAQLADPRRPDEHPRGSNPSGPSDPPGGCPPPLGYVSRSLNAPFRDPGTALATGGRLRGNNTNVYRILAGAFGALGTPDGSAWRFDYPFGSADSVETALFFSTNFAHDFFYDLGFDEASGNLQADNFGRGGLGGDALITLARASGRNNASFEPTPEGQSPTMSLFLFDGSGCWGADVDADGVPDLDGGYDSDVVIHEYHHGVSFRLNPDFTGVEADAMGEGGGDFFAYSVSGNTELAEFSAPPIGIRAVNDKTYADFTCLFFFYCEPHDNGEIWANVLWDVREAFRSDLVGGSEATAISEVHRLYLDGLALSPPSPTMLDLRDAVLQADLLRNPATAPGGSENYCRIWTAFAGRGMGQNALDTADTGDNTVVAGDEIPTACPQPLRVSLSVTDAQSAEAGLDPGSFTVTRTGDTSAELIVPYTVGGTAGPGTDYEALPGSVTLAPGVGTASIAVIPFDDDAYEAPETVTVTLAPSAVYEIAGPASGTVTISSDDPGPDLVVSALTAPSPSGAGLTLSLSETTKNQGAAGAPPSITAFYLSANGTLEATDAFLASRPVPALAPGALHTAATSVTIPNGTAPGSYYVLARADADSAFLETNEANNNRLALVVVGPDLAVSALTAPASTGVGATISVNDTTKNQGGGAAAATTTRFFLSTNAVLDAADVPLGSRAVPALAPGAVSAWATSLVLPAGTPGGSYYLIAQADADTLVAETSEANNTRAAVIAIGADLVVSALTAPSPSGAGLTLSVSDTTKNQGAGSAPPSTTAFYLSTNGTYETTDTFLASRAVPALAPGALHIAATAVTIPDGTAPGNYYVLARADADAAFLETSETNNTRISLVVVGPDLAVSALTAPTSAGAGATLSVADTTKNQGGGTAGATATRFFLSTNTVLDAADVPLGSRAVPALAPGAVSAGATALVLPAGTPGGSYYLIALADADALVAETSEANNTRTAVIAIGADLVVSALTAPSPSGAGLTLSVSDTTKNQGAGSAPPSTTAFYLSTNGTYETTDAFLASRAVPALAPGALHTVATSVTIPDGTAPGNYYVLARADADSAFLETSETNNTRISLVVVGPDLAVSALTAPTSAGAGATISVNDTTKNQGGGTAGATATRFFLSANTVLDAADVPLASRAVPALAPGAVSAGATSLVLPAGTPGGSYYLIAQADADTLVAETSEANNTRTAVIAIGADLVVSALTAPSPSGAGLTLSVSDTTKNQGAGSAPPSTTAFYLSTNGTYETTDTFLASRAVPALAPGALSTAATAVTIPEGTAPGNYYVLARADADTAFLETSETNNTRISLVVVGPDLAVSALTAPTSAGAGATISVNDTTKNQGGGTAGATATRFFLSTNTVLDAADVPLGSRAVGALVPGAVEAGSISLTIPLDTPGGNYYVIAQADGDTLVAETSETNNSRAALILISAAP